MNWSFLVYNSTLLVLHRWFCMFGKHIDSFDKKLHVFCEFVIAAFIGVLVSFIHFPSAIIAAVIAFAVAFAFGIYKEVKDSKQKGNHFCVWDLAWDIVGCLVGAVFVFLANYYTWHDIASNLIE